MRLRANREIPGSGNPPEQTADAEARTSKEKGRRLHILTPGIHARIFLLLLAVIVPVMLLQASSYYGRFNSQRSQELQANLEIARAVEQTFGTFVNDVVHQELAIGIGVTLSNASEEEKSLILDEINSEYPAIRDFSWLDPFGRVTASSDRSLIGTELGDQAYVRQIVGGKEWVLGRLMPSKSSGRPTFAISRGIRDKANVMRGIVVATVVPEKLDMMSTIERAGQGGVIVIDDRGMVVYSYPEMLWNWADRDLTRSFPNILKASKNKETTATVLIHERKWMVALTPILNSPGWIAGAGRPAEEVIAPVISGLMRDGVVFLVVVAIAATLGLAVSRTITVPLRHLRRHASKLGRGETDHILEARGPGELRELARDFNQMAKKVRKRETALRRAHDELEARVKKRTLKLAETNNALQTEIAERRKAEENLRVYTDKLEWSNQELQDFAFVASHDLQEPLRKIQTFGDLLKDKSRVALDDEHRDYLERMQNAARRMQTLINALLTYSRVTTKAQPFELVDLEETARKALSNLEVRIEETGARVELKNLPTIEADPSQMMQLFQNLIGNALKFHRKGEPPSVVVSGERIASRSQTGDADGLCVISVKDNGIGFDPQNAKRIFLPFQRLHGRSEYDGTGIGLAICHKIAERHGGTITAESSPGSGSKFIIRLPVKQPESDKD